MEVTPDFLKLLRAFAALDVRYMLVGAYAVDFHGQPRSTRHLDVWLDDVPDNMECVYRALEQFGAPALAINHLSAAAPTEIVWLGVPPDRVDLMKGLPGCTFADAWTRKVNTELDGVKVNIIGRDDLVAAKRAAGRDKDLEDAEALAKRA